jgi:CheY-like chemotaxis protein
VIRSYECVIPGKGAANVEKKILVVDDEKKIVDLLYHFLAKEGFKVFTATDGESCLRIAREEAPDLIVLDVIMPGMDGGDIASSLKQDIKTKDIPVIFLTGALRDEEGVKDEGQIGNYLFISKSSDINQQIDKIKKVLGV